MGTRTYHVGMTHLILPACIVLAYAALPAAWGLRAWAVTVTLAGSGYLLTPETPWQDQGPFFGLGGVLLAGLLVLASLGVGVRVIWAVVTKRSLGFSPPVDSMSYRSDCLIAAVLGLAAGAIATLLLAANMRGMTGGLPLCLAVAAVAAAAALLALRLPGRLRPLAVTTLATMACLTLAGGTLYPSLILADNEVIEPDAPRCLRTPEGTAPTTDQLRLLTLPKAQSRRPNLVLTVMTDEGPKDFRWSYRSFAFRSYGSYDGGSCPS